MEISLGMCIGGTEVGESCAVQPHATLVRLRLFFFFFAYCKLHHTPLEST